MGDYRKPVKVTRRTQAAKACARWLDAYGEDGGGFGHDKVDVLRDLRALGDKPAPADVDRIIGNKSWTDVPRCDGCGAESPRAVILFADAYDENHTHVCRSCIAKAASMFRIGGTP